MCDKMYNKWHALVFRDRLSLEEQHTNNHVQTPNHLDINWPIIDQDITTRLLCNQKLKLFSYNCQESMINQVIYILGIYEIELPPKLTGGSNISAALIFIRVAVYRTLKPLKFELLTHYSLLSSSRLSDSV